jgi:hypothetical protein
MEQAWLLTAYAMRWIEHYEGTNVEEDIINAYQQYMPGRFREIQLRKPTGYRVIAIPWRGSRLAGERFLEVSSFPPPSGRCEIEQEPSSRSEPSSSTAQETSSSRRDGIPRRGVPASVVRESVIRREETVERRPGPTPTASNEKLEVDFEPASDYEAEVEIRWDQSTPASRGDRSLRTEQLNETPGSAARRERIRQTGQR